jgi:ribosomal silencing factor RsfS
MTSAELLDKASMKLAEVVLMLTAAGEKQLAAVAEELAEQVEFASVQSESKVPGKPRSQ